MRLTGKRASLPATGSEGCGAGSMTYLALRRSSLPMVALLRKGWLCGDRGLRLLRHEVAQHEGQDAAVQVIVDFDRRVDAQQHRHFLRRAVLAVDHERHVHL